MKEYKWGIIGCGHIANEMAQAFAEKGRKIYAIYSRNPCNAKAFAEKYGIEKVYLNADDFFSDPETDIVYIAVPHNRHLEYILKAAESKKHILCEKAITLNSDELEQGITACRKNGVILAEAMTIYHMPVFKQVSEYIQKGELGKVKLIEVNLGSNKDYDMTNRFFNPALAGGAMLDIGVYALSFARFFLTENADSISSFVKLAPTGVDEQAVMLLNNQKDEMASISLSLTAKLPRTASVSFENAYIEFDNYNRSRKAVITFLDGREPVTLESDPDASVLTYEIEDMEKSLSGDNLMCLDLTKDVMYIMTKARKEWGVIYPEEKD
ncbi:MAG: Gfo/Idh/MocA family oxidoreductase [Clostridiales bacterium]|nr:Gfo/Idh/MocA family oxidoreductase [Clostridiales bacterium]